MSPEMLRRHCFASWISVTLLLLSLSGCDSDLGECNLTGVTDEGRPIDGPAALDIAFRSTDGLPMYEGQALVQASCGNGQFCHAPAAERSDRIGVPKGLDFDLALACNETVDPACADPGSCDGDAESTYCQQLVRLESNQRRTNSWAGGMIAEIRNGAMPPGQEGRRVRDDTPWFRPDGSQLPSFGSDSAEDVARAKEIIRNWLACAAPVVARTQIAPSEQLQLTPCPTIDGETCVYNGSLGALPDPTWSSIYASLIFTRCLLCHAPANSNMDQNPDNPNPGGTIPGGASPEGLAALNLAGSNDMDTSNWAFESHAAVFNVPASAAGECEGQGTVVLENDSAGSLMIQKMRAIQTCGAEMPITGFGQSIPDATINIVAEWIDMGAPNN